MTGTEGDLGSGVQLLAQGPRWVAVAKPSGLPVVPTRQAPTGPDLRRIVEAALGRPVWVVHRIDQGTSGLVILALDADAHRDLCGAFERRRVQKTYLAICRRTRPEARTAGVIDAALAPGRRGAMRIAASGSPGAKTARTRFRVLGLRGELAVIEAHPETGRTHQIRVHLAGEGWPLAVDPRYGGAGPLLLPEPGAPEGPGGVASLDRLSLHALRLTLPPDVPDGGRTLEAPPPPDLAGILAALLQTTSD